MGAGIEQVWRWAQARWWAEDPANATRQRRRTGQRQNTRKSQVAGLLGFLLVSSAFWTGIDYFVRYADHPELETDFYVRDWELGNYVAELTPPFSAYLTPTQAEMATILFALGGDESRLSSFDGKSTTVPLGVPGEVLVYLVDPAATEARERLSARFPTASINPLQNGFIPYTLIGSTERIDAQSFTDATLGPGIGLVATTTEQAPELAVTLFWQATATLANSYTAFVHLVDEEGDIVLQRDRIPEGYPTQDWREGELVTDRYILGVTDGLPAGNYTLRTGFYDTVTLSPLGEPLVFASISLE